MNESYPQPSSSINGNQMFELSGMEETLNKNHHYDYNKSTIDPKNKENIKNLANFLKRGVAGQKNNQSNPNNLLGVRAMIPKSKRKFVSTSSAMEAKAITMKIRKESIRDRWLLNIRPFDYEVYLTSGFMLLVTRDELEFLKKTGMGKMVNREAQNLLYFIENNRSLEELRAIKRQRLRNMMNLQLSNFNYFISRNTTGYDIFSHKLMFAKITPEGIYIKADRKQTEFEYLSLKDIRIYLEDKPKDPNRFKAINQSWMPWADHRDLEGMNTRMVVNATKDNIPVSYGIYCNSRLEAKRLRDYMIIQFNSLNEFRTIVDLAIIRQKVRSSEWLYQKILIYCQEKLGADNLYFPNKIQREEMAVEKVHQDIPLFLEKGLLAFGSFSIRSINTAKFRRGISEWSRGDLSSFELGHREYNLKDIPSFTFDKIICNVEDAEIPFAAYLDIAVIKDRSMILKRRTLGYTFRRKAHNIAYLERAEADFENSHFDVEDIFRSSMDKNIVTIRLTLRLSGRRYEDFEFNLKAYCDSFYVKTISYVDFFNLDYVLVMKSLKLHESTKYDDFTNAFQRQNIFIDDFNSHRAKLPNFGPDALGELSESLLNSSLTFAEYASNDPINNLQSAEDGYVNNLYSVVFNKMRYDMIEDNYIKAKIHFDLWWDLVTQLKVPTQLLSAINYHYKLSMPASLDRVAFEICGDNRREVSEMLLSAVIGIKSEVRGILWETVSNKTGRYGVKGKLDRYAPLMVEQLYGMINKRNKYGVDCLFRSHQRIITHFMALIEEMSLGHPRLLNLLALEVKIVILMLHEFFTRDHFLVAARAILVLCSLMYETPEGRTQGLDYFLRRTQREVSLLKSLMEMYLPALLRHVYNLGLSVEGLVAGHLVNCFAESFQVELVLRIRDIYFLVEFMRSPDRNLDIDFFIIFKCCIILTILKRHKKLFLSVENAHEVRRIFKICCLTVSDFKNFLLETFEFMHKVTCTTPQNKPKNSSNANQSTPTYPRNSRNASSAMKKLKITFKKINQFLKKWEMEYLKLDIKRQSFVPLLQYTKKYFIEKRQKLEKVNLNRVQSERPFFQSNLKVYSTVNQTVDNANFNQFESKKGDKRITILGDNGVDFGSCIREINLRPQTYNSTSLQNSLKIYLHGLRKPKKGVFYLYFYAGEVVIFSTKITETGEFESNLAELYPKDSLNSIKLELRQESDSEEYGSQILKVENFSGKIELRRYRLGVIETDSIPLRSSAPSATPNSSKQYILDLSLLLNSELEIHLSEFEETFTKSELMLQNDNYWKYPMRWLLPDLVEQKSLIWSKDFETFSEEFFKQQALSQASLVKNSAVYFSSASTSRIHKKDVQLYTTSLVPFTRLIQQDYQSMVPLCRAFINGIFFSDFSISEKINLIWDTLTFFEGLDSFEGPIGTDFTSNRLQDSSGLTENASEGILVDGCLESDTIKYFLRNVIKKCWISLPEFSIENMVDLVFRGRVPAVKKALYFWGEDVVDLTQFFRAMLNHAHLATGKRCLNLSNVGLREDLFEFLTKNFPRIFAQKKPESLYLAVSTCEGTEHYSLVLKLVSTHFEIKSILEQKKYDILVQNPRIRISRADYDSKMAEFSIFSHIDQLQVLKRASTKFQINCYVLLKDEWFEGVAMSSEDEVMALHEEFPEWDRSLFENGLRLGRGKYLCFLVIRPWELLVIDVKKIIFI